MRKYHIEISQAARQDIIRNTDYIAIEKQSPEKTKSERRKIIMKKSIMLLGIMVGTFLLGGVNVKASEDQYSYPIMPGTEEWAQYNHAERVEMLNIDDNILTNMATENLVDTVLEYPLFSDMYYYGGYQEGFEVVASHFNGLEELLNRQNAASCLIEEYEEQQVANSMEEQERCANLEVILAQPEIQSDMTEEQRIIIANEQMGYSNKNGISSNLFSRVYEKCIEEQNREDDGVQETANLNVITPNGTAVPVQMYGETLTAEDKAYMAQDVRNSYPSAVILGSATSNYNCHSYAWHQQSTQNKFWMESPHYYWADGSYTRNSAVSLDTPPVNTRVVYDFPNLVSAHSAIAQYSSGLRYASKWGITPLVRHSAYDNPYYYSGVSIKAYTR